jgi:hypothetical protein
MKGRARSRTRTLLWIAAAQVAVVAVGCADVIGLNKLSEGVDDAGAESSAQDHSVPDGSTAESGDDTSADSGATETGGDATATDVTTTDSSTPDVVTADTHVVDVVTDVVTADVEDAADASTDAPADQNASDGNPCATGPTTDFYVDSLNGRDTNNGAAPSCAFQTITAALTASSGTASSNATIHLAAGTYGAGETFPLVLNHGRSLVGAAPGTTKIQGSSTAYNTSSTGSFLDVGTHYVTILAGDVMSTAYGLSTISGVSILPASTVTTPTAGYMGIACIAGNAPNTGAVPPLPSPNLFLQRVVVGPNFDYGVAIGSSPSHTTACNLFITQSTVTTSNVGLGTGLCGTTNPVVSWPSAQVGDGVGSDQNAFVNSGIDVFGGGCGSAQSINGNDFSGGYRGIVIISQPAQYFEIIGNQFNGGSTTYPMGFGVQTNATTVISKLNGNTFTGIAESAAADTAVGGTTGFAISMYTVLQAHANLIHDNDNGVALGIAPPTTFDFSSDTSSANANAIYCNSKVPGASGVGYDVVLTYDAGSPVNFTGNKWDHASPTTGTSATASPNGTDVVTGNSGGASLTGSTADGVSSCASGRVQ